MASVRYHDGYLEDVVKIEGSAKYTSTIRRFVEQKETKNSQGTVEVTNILFDEIKRRWNRLLGRPSTTEIGIIASFLSEIKTKVQELTGLSVDQAVIAIPNLFETDNIQRQQFQLDVDEASTHAGIKPIFEPNWISAASAGVASQGWGLCSNYTDILTCEAEEETMPIETVLTVEYTKNALVVAMFRLQTANSVSDKFTRVYFDIGANHEQEEDHWTIVKHRIQNLSMNIYKKMPTKVLVTGAAASSTEFLEALREALEGLGIDKAFNETVASGYDPVFVVARGAAEFAKRKQEMPRYCIEADQCKDIRKKLKEEYRRGDEKQRIGDHLELR